MEDILDVYKRPYDERFPVVCMDESSKQLVKEVRQPLAATPGQPYCYDSEYERNGVCNLFLHIEPLTGRCDVKVTDRRCKTDWAHFIKELVEETYPDAEKIVLIMDNLNTHKGASLYETFPPDQAKKILDRLEIHYTPVHGSWLNIAEIEFSHLSRQCLDRRIPDKVTCQREIAAWVTHRNQLAPAVDWQFTTEKARIKLKKLYPLLT